MHKAIAIFAMTTLLMTSTAAVADTTTLVCRMDASIALIEDEPTMIELDEAQSSVVIHFGQTRINAAGSGRVPSYSLGPLSAKFGTDTITFSYPVPNTSIVMGYAINRLTGAFADTKGEKWNCQPAHKQF